LALTGEKKGNSHHADDMEAVYAAAPHDIERCDLLVGDLYENKSKGFAISETSFIIFLVKASRRLDADPFLKN
jgi:alpha-dioxygenase